MAAGIFYVYTEPGSVDEAEFHDWYDNEHGPARLTVPGVGSAYRYRALDDQKPTSPSAPGWPPWTDGFTSRSARTGRRWAGRPR